MDERQQYAEYLGTISGLSQWRNWFLILTFVVGAIALSYFYGGGDGVAKAFYATILLLGAGTLTKNFFDARFLDEETKLASLQVKQLSELDDVEAFLANAENSLFRSHISALYTIFLSHSEIDQSSLIELLHRKLSARNRMSELFASLLITLGLIGTIVGLILMTSSLKTTMGTFEAGNTDVLIPQLFGEGGALYQLDTAFYTTLLGATLGGVFLRVLSSVVSANTMHYVSHLAELTEVHVLPSLRNMATRLSDSGYYSGESV